MVQRVKTKKKKDSPTRIRSKTSSLIDTPSDDDLDTGISIDRIIRDTDIDDFINQYEEAILIDEHALDDMLVQQPEAFYRVSKALALQISRRDAAKQYLQNAEAKADEKIRSRAKAKGEKLTEREVDARKRSYEDVVAASNDLMRLNHTVGQLSALKEAFQQRSFVLKDLVGLYIANYYGDSSAGVSSSKAKDKAASDARQALNAARQKRSGD